MKTVITTIVVTLCASPVAAQTVPDGRLNGLVREALAQVAGPTGPSGPRVDLTLDEAVRRALERNLDIAVERLNPQTYDLSLAQLNASYRPVLSSTIGQQSRIQPPTSQLNGGQRVSNETTTYNSGVVQDVPWGGGRFSLTWNNGRNETSNIFSNFNPSYQTNLTAIYTQPLLQGFSIDGTRQQLRVTRINRDISEIQLRATITNTLADVRTTYWDLVFAVEAVQVARRSLDLAEKLVEDNKLRVEIGTLAPIDVVQAEAEAAARRQTLAQAEATWRTAELGLKRLIVGGTEDELWRASIDPIDRPTFQPEPIDAEAAVRNALSKRTDLLQSRRQIEANQVTLRYLRNQTLPAVDLVATYGLQGLGGTQIVRGTGALGQQAILDRIPGGYADALSALTGRDFPTWNLTLNVSYPIGISAAEAQHARARVQLQQAEAELRALELQVATEVTSITLQVQSNLQRVQAAMAARELAQKRLEAEQSKFEVGLSTNFFVVQAQRDLADAQNAELRALLDYRKSLVDYERVQETSLSRAGITIVSGGGGGGASAGQAAGPGQSSSFSGGGAQGGGSQNP